MASPVQQLTASLQSTSTTRLIEMIKMIGGGFVSTEEMMVRAALIDAYEAREGESAADELMTDIGL